MKKRLLVIFSVLIAAFLLGNYFLDSVLQSVDKYYKKEVRKQIVGTYKTKNRKDNSTIFITISGLTSLYDTKKYVFSNEERKVWVVSKEKVDIEDKNPLELKGIVYKNIKINFVPKEEKLSVVWEESFEVYKISDEILSEKDMLNKYISEL